MDIVNRKGSFVLLIGDILFFFLSLWLTLTIRYLDIPTADLFNAHLVPFSIIFIFSVFVFYIGGLYERHTLVLRDSLPNLLLKTQAINSGFAVLLFYFVPLFSVAPKTNLFIYLILSVLLDFIWRLVIFSSLFSKSKQRAVVIGSGEETDRLISEVNNNDLYPFVFSKVLDSEKINSEEAVADFKRTLFSDQISMVVADIYDKNVSQIWPKLYDSIFSGIQFVDSYRVYESIFEQAPLSLLNHGWFLKHVSLRNHFGYDFFKRLGDIVFSLLLGIPSLAIYPLVYLLIKFDDGGRLFYLDSRVGRGNKIFNLIKFRSMNEANGGQKVVSKVGRFLRKTRIDELPQLWNVLKGEMSLVGPRPEKIELTKLYKEQIPFYDIRNIIKPGLSGWAQLKQENHPHHAADLPATREKLSYDLYYIKNRSFLLDFKVALQTIRVLLSRKGK
ncbi:MAG TPA: sugar transferase [Candidatus Paceibacterota bacterium]|nr:sugar transferase [Candidatus Paceibacterota bacterium]HRZ34716.1 sugar transferase [Candidatus Paceibacterota bacterium]